MRGDRPRREAQHPTGHTALASETVFHGRCESDDKCRRHRELRRNEANPSKSELPDCHERPPTGCSGICPTADRRGRNRVQSLMPVAPLVTEMCGAWRKCVLDLGYLGAKTS